MKTITYNNKTYKIPKPFADNIDDKVALVMSTITNPYSGEKCELPDFAATIYYNIKDAEWTKHYQTRRRSSFYYLGGNACSMNCERNWYEKFGNRAVDHFGRIHEPIKLTEENAWYKFRDWGPREGYYFANQLSEQQIPITEEQYNNKSLVRP